MHMEIRKATQKDVDDIRQLFYNTINTVNTKDYSAAQIKVWSAGYENTVNWIRKISEQYFVVADSGKPIIGFGSITTGGYIDFLFVHKDHQGKGIAKAILGVLEKRALDLRLKQIWADVSITAKPFFISQGFIVTGIHDKEIRGIIFKNTVMNKFYTEVKP